MHTSDTYTLEGSPEQLSRLLRCSVADVHTAVSDLSATGAADITERNGIFTLISRRRKREIMQRLNTRERVRKHRSNSDVTLYDCDSECNSSAFGNGDARGKGNLPPEFSEDAEFMDLWRQFVASRVEMRKPLTERAAKMSLVKLVEYGLDGAKNSLQNSIAGEWQGIFPPGRAVQKQTDPGDNGFIRKPATDAEIHALIDGNGGPP